MEFNRRQLLVGGSAIALARGLAFGQSRSLGFTPIDHNQDAFGVAPGGYQVSLVIGWGAAMLPGAKEFNYDVQNGETQSKQFGYNCDFIGYFPLPDYGSGNSRSGILSVNHESTSGGAMFRGYQAANTTLDLVNAELAAVGLSLVEVRRGSFGGWEYVDDSRFNRRITGETVFDIAGPAAGDDMMKTSYDAAGLRVRGTWTNCAGGKTPWGTVLSGEEGFGGYFANRNSMPEGSLRDLHTRYGVTAGVSSRRWENFHPRFDMRTEPNEPNRFGWVIEADPYNPNAAPKKRTALGRASHEGATCRVAQDGRVAVYTGDDARFEFVYKFVSAGRFDPNNRAANLDLLDKGTLYVARFDDDLTGEWMPLVWGEGPLTPANGFRNQAEVLIKARLAGTAIGATPMDRPEDVEANPLTGKVYVVCTSNDQRTASGATGVNAANPRPVNRWGHIIEVIEDGDDAAATRFRWSMFMLCGDPKNPAHRPTYYGGYDQSKVWALASPDNLAFDGDGNAWITTDGMVGQIDSNEGLFVCPTEGPERGRAQLFATMPAGSEATGPEFTPDFESLFLAVQHPGGTWPGATTPARPAVLAFTKVAGSANRKIGT